MWRREVNRKTKRDEVSSIMKECPPQAQSVLSRGRHISLFPWQAQRNRPLSVNYGPFCARLYLRSLSPSHCASPRNPQCAPLPVQNLIFSEGTLWYANAFLTAARLLDFMILVFCSRLMHMFSATSNSTWWKCACQSKKSDAHLETWSLRLGYKAWRGLKSLAWSRPVSEVWGLVRVSFVSSVKAQTTPTPDTCISDASRDLAFWCDICHRFRIMMWHGGIREAHYHDRCMCIDLNSASYWFGSP
jgi:hypothetical protein